MIRKLMESLAGVPLPDERYSDVELGFDPLPTLQRWDRMRGRPKAIDVLYESWYSYNRHLPEDFTHRLNSSGRVSKAKGISAAISVVRGGDWLDFIRIHTQSHELNLEFIRVQPKELQNGHLELGSAYKDYSYPPSALLWVTSSNLQAAGWVCSKFNFDKEADALEIQYVEPEFKKETVTINVNFKVMKDDIEFMNRPEPEPEYEFKDLYHMPHAKDLDGYELGQFSLYNPLLVSGALHWERVDPDGIPYDIGTTYIRFGEWMMRDKFMLETIRIFDVYMNEGIDFVNVAKLHMQNRNIGEEFNRLYNVTN